MAAPARVRHDGHATTVVFGTGALSDLPDLLAEAGARRLALLDGLPHAGPADRVAALLGPGRVLRLRVEQQHVPSGLAERARAAVEAGGVDWLVALGGGSTLGVAKAVAHATGLPIAAVPTTYAGSEMTPIWGITEDAHKRVSRDPWVLPRLVVYDPELTVGLPSRASGASGINAVAHCVEAFWTPRRTPVTDAVATEGLLLLARELPRVVRHPGDLAARGGVLRGAWLAGLALAGAGTALHHRICHVLGGTFGLPHADVHACVLPAVVEHVAAAVPDALARVGRALDTADAVAGLRALCGDVGAPTSLTELGLTGADAARAAELVVAEGPTAPVPVTVAGVAAILDRARIAP